MCLEFSKRQLLLGLLLREFNSEDTEFNIETLEKRVELQKSIYLIQRLGFNLGYRFSWYKRGPYSQKLADDSYKINEVSNREEIFDSYSLNINTSKIENLRTSLIQSKPDDLDMQHWLEIIASVDYLVKVRGLSKPKAKQIIVEEKQNLSGHFDKALEFLKSNGIKTEH